MIDLLPDRSPVSFADWLINHPEVRIIGRDRGGEYREGARRGAADAVQVDTRFHLIKNFTAIVEKMFKRHVSLVCTHSAKMGQKADGELVLFGRAL